jgi:histidyl-tRNA synthetase
VTAEAELLAAIVAFFKSVGLTAKEIGIKVSSRKVRLPIIAERHTATAVPLLSVIYGEADKLIVVFPSPHLKQVIEKIIDDLKIPQAVFAQTCIIVDKLDKMERADVVQQLGTTRVLRLELRPGRLRLRSPHSDSVASFPTRTGALDPPVPEDVAGRLIDTLSVKSIEELGALIGEEHEAVKELKKLFWLAQSYGYADWIQFDASVTISLSLSLHRQIV